MPIYLLKRLIASENVRLADSELARESPPLIINKIVLLKER
jgi:hypothetical protein